MLSNGLKIEISYLEIKIQTRETINVSTTAVVLYFYLMDIFLKHLVIDSKYIKMTGMQDFY